MVSFFYFKVWSLLCALTAFTRYYVSFQRQAVPWEDITAKLIHLDCLKTKLPVSYNDLPVIDTWFYWGSNILRNRHDTNNYLGSHKRCMVARCYQAIGRTTGQVCLRIFFCVSSFIYKLSLMSTRWVSQKPYCYSNVISCNFSMDVNP